MSKKTMLKEIIRLSALLNLEILVTPNEKYFNLTEKLRELYNEIH